MVRKSKKKTKGSSGFSLFDDADSGDVAADEDLPHDEAGRRKIKLQYVDLLGIRLEKLKGRILNRERINKSLEGVYFICVRCLKVCHNLDEGLVEDEANEANICTPCASAAAAQPVKPAKSSRGGKSSKASKKAKKATKRKPGSSR